MRQCSWFVIAGFTLLVVGLAFCGYIYWYAGEYVPDFPSRNTGKIIQTPRSDAQIGALFGAVLVVICTSVMSLIGILIGPRTRWCLILGLIAPAPIVLLTLLVNSQPILRALREMFL